MRIKCKKLNLKYNIVLIICGLILISSIFISLKIGYKDISWKDIFKIIFYNINYKIINLKELNIHSISIEDAVIIKNIRLTRIFLALITGSILSSSGVVYQGVLKNPLADPYILGISSGASFGAGLSILLKFNFLGIYTTSICAFIFGIFSLLFVLKIATFNKKINSLSLILSGIIISSFFSAGLGFVSYLAGKHISEIIFWIMGTLSSVSYHELIFLFLVSTVSILIFHYYSEQLNILSLGEKIAVTSGINTTKLRIILLTTASIATAISISICGIIGFVGLIVPHFVRILVGPDNKRLIILSAIIGGEVMLISDTIIRGILSSEVPIGVITSILGAPFFIYIFRKKIGDIKI